MKTKTQIFLIHGGNTFKTQKDYLYYLKTKKISLEPKVRWSDAYLDKELGGNFEIIRPRMPLQDNAKYGEWKMWFERHIPFLRNNIILIGNSLGGIFLAKYLSEHKFSKKILATILVCPPFDNSLETKEELVGGFKLKGNLSLLEKNSKNLSLLFSKDDDIVPVSHAEKYRNKLKKAKIIIFKSKNGHFKVSRFPEIITIINSLK
ncbi:MAG: alpha/beta hydrolase [Candidatus Paceibacterota bacterium]